MKKIIALMLALLLIFATLVGCGETTSSSASSAEQTAVTLTAAYELPGFEAAFEAAHPDIDLQVETMATAVINGEVTRRLRNNHGSDLIITSLPQGEIADYAYDLSAEACVEQYQASAMKSLAIEGKFQYLPLPGTYYGYIINKTLVEKLGLLLPETREDLLNILETSQTMGIGTSQDGYNFGFSDAGSTFLGAYFAAEFSTDFLVTAEGAKWLASYEDKTATFTGSWESSVDFIQTCVNEGYLDSNRIILNYNGKLDTNSNAFKAEEELANGTAVLTFGNLDMLKKIQNGTQDEIVLLPCLPATGEGTALLSAVSNDYIAVNASLSEEQRQAALTVLDYLSTTEGQEAWMSDTSCTHSYLKDYEENVSALPENIQSYVTEEMVFSNPFPTNILTFLGKNLSSVAKGSMDIASALSAIDDYYLNGNEDVEYDLSVVGSVACDMLYENANTRKEETQLGNLISDAIRELTGADVALVNGGGIRSSLYEGDVTGDDLTHVCPYGNLIIVAEMSGATLKEAITNGIQKTWKPAGQFLQVSGICYSFTPAADETETAVLLSCTYADGSPVEDDDIITVAYTNYMAGSSGYVDAGDNFTMLNVYDTETPVQVTLLEETGKTYGDALKAYFAAHSNEKITASLEGRITVVN